MYVLKKDRRSRLCNSTQRKLTRTFFIHDKHSCIGVCIYVCKCVHVFTFLNFERKSVSVGMDFSKWTLLLVLWSAILSVGAEDIESFFALASVCTAAFWRGSMTHGLARSLGPPIFSNMLRSRLKTLQKTWYFHRTETRACVVAVMAFLIDFPWNERIHIWLLTSGIFLHPNIRLMIRSPRSENWPKMRTCVIGNKSWVVLLPDDRWRCYTFVRYEKDFIDCVIVL